MDDTLKVTGVLSQGYGVIPKLIMKDTDLSIEAKAIYAYIASYAGNGSTAFPSIKLICTDLEITENRFHRHKKPLVEKGYIQISRERNEKGTFERNVYTINSVIVKEQAQDVVHPTRQNEGLDTKEPTRQNPGMDKPSMDSPGMENRVTNNNSINNNSLNNNSITNNNNKEKGPVAVPEKNAFQIYQENFGMLSPIVTEEIMHWEKDVGSELVIEAMKRAALNQKPFSWAVGIMRNWVKKNIQTIEQAEADDVSFLNNQQRKQNNYRGGAQKVEKKPDWMDEPQPTEEKMISPEKQAEFEERLIKFRAGKKEEGA